MTILTRRNFIKSAGGGARRCRCSAAAPSPTNR